MKKLLAIVLVMAMLCSLTACGTLTDILMQQMQKEYSRGTMEGQTYESEFLGIGCKLPETWSFYDDEEIKKLNKDTIDMLGDERQEIMKKSGVIYDMVASDTDKINNMNVVLEEVGAMKLAKLDLEAYYEEQIPIIRDSFRDMGMSFSGTQGEVGKATVGGKELSCIKMTIKTYGKTMHQVGFAIKSNGYLAMVTVSATDEETLQKLLDAFYWLE